MPIRGAGITITYTAWDLAAGAGKTADAANHTLRWGKDGVFAAPANAPAEIDATNAPGEYKLVLTDAECTCNMGRLVGKSSTSNVSIHGSEYPFTPTSAAAGDAMTLTADERTAIATRVEQQIISETDSNAVLQAIVDKIAAMNPDLQNLTTTAIAAAVHDALVTVAGRKLAIGADGSVVASNAGSVDEQAIADAVNTVLTTDHGAGSWQSQVILSVSRPSGNVGPGVNRSMFCNERVVERFEVKDVAGNPVDVTGQSLQLEVERIGDATVGFTSTEIAIDGNKADVTITSDKTNIPAGQYLYRLWDTETDHVHAHGTLLMVTARKPI